MSRTEQQINEGGMKVLKAFEVRLRKTNRSNAKVIKWVKLYYNSYDLMSLVSCLEALKYNKDCKFFDIVMFHDFRCTVGTGNFRSYIKQSYVITSIEEYINNIISCMLILNENDPKDLLGAHHNEMVRGYINNYYSHY